MPVKFLTFDQIKKYQIKAGDSIEFLSDRLTDKGPCTAKVGRVHKGTIIVKIDDSTISFKLEDEINNMKRYSSGSWAIK